MTVACRTVWGRNFRQCAKHLTDSSAPTEINKDCWLMDRTADWHSASKPQTHLHQKSSPPIPLKWTSWQLCLRGGQSSETKMIGKRHNFTFINRERLKTGSTPPPPPGRDANGERNTPTELNTLLSFFLFSYIPQSWRENAWPLNKNDAFISTCEVVREFGYNLLLDVNNLEKGDEFPSQI